MWDIDIAINVLILVMSSLTIYNKQYIYVIGSTILCIKGSRNPKQTWYYDNDNEILSNQSWIDQFTT